jgi:hypothetical protein
LSNPALTRDFEDLMMPAINVRSAVMVGISSGTFGFWIEAISLSVRYQKKKGLKALLADAFSEWLRTKPR